MGFIESNLLAGLPVLAAIPSQWGRGYSGQDMVDFGGSTHEVCFCDVQGGNLVAMNPWPVDGRNAFYQVAPIAWWAERIVYGRLDVLDGEGNMGYKINGDGTVTFTNGVTLPGGMSSEVLQHGAPRADDQPVRPEYYIGSDLAVVEWQSGDVWTWRHTRPAVNRFVASRWRRRWRPRWQRTSTCSTWRRRRSRRCKRRWRSWRRRYSMAADPVESIRR